jgi:predicted RNA-binding protein with PUA domain
LGLGTDEIAWTPTYNQTTSSGPTPPPSANDNGKKKEQPPTPPVAAPRRTLHIRFSLTEDARLDAARLDDTLALLADYPGEDRFTIIFFDASDEIRIIFPDRTTRYAPDLKAGLQRLLGKDCLTVTRNQSDH